MDNCEESEHDSRIREQCGGCTRVALTVERAVQVCMPLHWVPLHLYVCRVSSAIVDRDEESKQAW
jgi:hypothetical protein